MSKRLIISRYNEDISWLDKHKDFYITVYNKGLELQGNQQFNIINLENVGRESHTWIYHIVSNYYKLDDINIFLQGRIDDLGCMAFKDPNKYMKVINKLGFASSRYGLLGPFHWKWNVGIENDERYKILWKKGEISESKLGFRKFSKVLFPKIPKIVATSYGGCFAVKKELIRKYEISFYEKLLKVLSMHRNPIEGHYMERLWCYMFTKNKFFFKAIQDVLYTKIENLFKNN